MRDTEYRDAMIEMISEFDKDIFIEIADASGGGRNAVILTDIRPEEIERDVLRRLCTRTVFLTPVRPDDELRGSDRRQGIHRIFKYSSLTDIMSELSVVYSEWTGDTGGNITLSECIAVCGETDLGSSIRCKALARQMIYRRGGKILILPAGYINDYPADCAENCFARLMYMVSGGKEIPAEGYTHTDQYGISYLNLPAGRNPVSELDRSYLVTLVSSVGSRFDTIIIDAASCFRSENTELIRSADHIIWFGTGRRISDPALILGEGLEGKLKMIDTSSDASLELDDLVREMYGREESR